VSEEALTKRHKQGWVVEIVTDLNILIDKIKLYKKEKISSSIGFHGNVVDVWEAILAHFNKTGELLVDLGSDQTSCHNPYLGGYFPVQVSAA
jgi:urocanate hydratase